MNFLRKKDLILLGTLIWVFSCTDNFEEINQNNNVPTEAVEGAILPTAIFEPGNTLIGRSFNWFEIIMHYRAQNTINNLDVYNLGAVRLDELWDSMYKSISDLNTMEAIAIESGNVSYQAVAKILKSYYFAVLTEIWIDIPYAESGFGLDGNITPIYDSQETIYLDILGQLEAANQLLNGTEEFNSGGDVLFDGDVMKWKKLANSLRLRYLLRLSNVSAVNAASEIASIFNDPVTYPIFENESDQAVYDFTGEAPNISDLATSRLGEFDFAPASERIVALLTSWNDPRLDFFFRLPLNPEINEHVGIPNGISEAEAGAWNGSGEQNVSLYSLDIPLNPDVLDFAIMTYAELQFILAESAMKGWISGDAETYYNTGIQATFNYWNIELPVDYLTQEEVVWNDSMERLMDQKWMSYYITGALEAWGEYRRTGLPNLEIGPTAGLVTGGLLPTRQFYPLSEQSLNSSNLQEAISRIGGDEITIRHWYQD